MAVDLNSNSWQGYGRSLVSWLLHPEGWSNFWRRPLFYFNFLLNELVWEGNCVNTEGVRWKMYEIMYNVQIFQEELCCNHHLAASAPCRTSSAWSVNSMAVFAYKSTLCETPDRWFQVVSFGFIKHPFPSLIFKLWANLWRKRILFSHPMPPGVCPCSSSLKWPKLKSNQTGSMYINLLDLDPLAAIDPKNSGLSAIFHTICFQK